VKRNRGTAVKPESKHSRAAIRPAAGLAHEFGQTAVLAWLSLATLLLTLPIYAPLSFWPAAHVAFVPWLVGICLYRHSGRTYLFSYLLGAGFFLYHLRWMHHTTREGYFASILLYIAFSFPLAAWAIRHAWRHRNLPLVLVFPVVWTALDWLRAHGPLAFPWFLLGHTQIKLSWMVQIADIGGAYAVSFVVAMVNGWLADRVLWFLQHRRDPKAVFPRRIPIGATAMVLVVAATLLYGWYRLNTRSVEPGPRIAVLQGDFVLTPTDPPADDKKRLKYHALIAEAAASSPAPDLIVLPETPFGLYLNREIRD
jgi:apolipoprotein N-acyltransferase